MLFRWNVWSGRGLYLLLGMCAFLLATRWDVPADPVKSELDLQMLPTFRMAQGFKKGETLSSSPALSPPVSTRMEHDFMLQAGDRIFFTAQSSELGSREREILSAQARWLKAHETISGVLQGYADDPPLTDQQQEQLAEQRAEEVMKFLVREGVLANRLSVVSMGKKHPIALCEDSTCAAQNRRVVTVLSPQKIPQSASPRGAGKKDTP